MLFNLAGYRLVFAYSLQQWDKRVASLIDKEAYNEQDLITIKIPLSLPYQTDWKAFERVDGEITLHGKLYKYVKRKVVNGELVLMCLPDPDRAKLQTAKDDFFKLANNLQTTTPVKKQATSGLASFSDVSCEYDDHQQDWRQQLYSRELPPDFFIKAYTLLTRSRTTPEQPPDTGKA